MPVACAEIGRLAVRNGVIWLLCGASSQQLWNIIATEFPTKSEDHPRDSQPNRNPIPGVHNNYGTLCCKFPTIMEDSCMRSQHLWNVICIRFGIRCKCSISVGNLHLERPHGQGILSCQERLITHDAPRLRLRVHNNYGMLFPRSQQYWNVIRTNFRGWSDFA